MKIRKIVCIVMAIAMSMLMGTAVWGAVGGDILWEKTISYAPQYNQVFSGGSIASPTSFIVTGYAKNADGTGGQLAFLKAYDVATGNFKWGGDLTLGTTNSINSLGLNGNICLVRNFSMTPTGQAPPALPYSLFRTVIQAYNADTGALLWENPEDYFGPSGFTVPNTPVFQSLPNRFFVTGNYVDYTTGQAQQSTLIVRAYQDRTVVLAKLPLIGLRGVKSGHLFFSWSVVFFVVKVFFAL